MTKVRRPLLLLRVWRIALLAAAAASTATAFVVSPASRSPLFASSYHKARTHTPLSAAVVLPLVATMDLKAQLQRQQQTLKEQVQQQEQELSEVVSNNVDQLHARAGVLRRSILQQQLELQQLERHILCCTTGDSNHSAPIAKRMWTTFQASTRALVYRLGTIQQETNLLRQRYQRSNRNRSISTTTNPSTNPINNNNNRPTYPSSSSSTTSSSSSSRRFRQWNSLGDFVATQTTTGLRIVDGLLQNMTQIQYVVRDPDVTSLVPHVPLILSRLDRLESHVGPILERVLNNQRHVRSIEPYLPQILERLDDIEPHLPWILDHIDVLAPYTGLLLQHIDELLLYADVDEYETTTTNHNGNRYAFAEQLLPYLEFYVSRLDTVGPHLPLLRPHMSKLLQHNRIAKMTPYIDRLFALGYKDNLGASANLDVLLFWFGWALRIPGLPRLFFAIPGSPYMVTFLANRLPKRFVRGYCSGISCTVDNDYGGRWNQLSPLPPPPPPPR